jgi:2-C-methyl-D-erythritol 2,4-cyclodiphosphate synthase
LFGHDSKAAFRIGSGYDIHPFGKDKEKKLVLGGIEIDHEGLEGHSDSDAVAHALTDALLSAIGAPDLGSLFPASDVNNKDVSSLIFLEKAVALVTNEGYKLGNANIIVNAQEPKLSPHIDEMNTKLSETLAPSLLSKANCQLLRSMVKVLAKSARAKQLLFTRPYCSCM